MAKETILADFHRAHGGRMVEFAGWNLPVMYTSIIEEHKAVREASGLFDVSHMGQCFVEGESALAFLNNSLTNDFSDLRQNKAKYALLCNSKGECLDDLIVYKISDAKFLLILNASNCETDVAYLTELAANFADKITITNVSDKYAMLALQGPDSAKILQKILGEDFSALERFSFAQVGESFVSRTGYTGSEGFEIILPNENALELANKFADAGVKLCGLGARDSLRLEARYPLYVHELSKEINCFEAGLGWAVKLDKEAVCTAALKAIKSAGLKRKVAHFKVLDKRIVRDGAELFDSESGKVCGRVLSGAWSPMQDSPILSALVEIEFLSKELFAKVRDNRINLELKKNFIS